MSLSPLDSLLLSLAVPQSLEFHGFCHFIHMAHGSGSVLSKMLPLTDTMCLWVGMGGALQVLPLLLDPGKRTLLTGHPKPDTQLALNVF